jgi:uncharacterized alpha-E superfamily protein
MDMLSRVADNLYWMSRYLERAEHTGRVLEVHLAALLEELPADEESRWRIFTESLGLVPPGDARRGDIGHWLSINLSNRSSIISCIMSARDNARQVREQISSEMWEQINRLFHSVRNASIDEEWSSAEADFLREVREGSLLFQGITDSTMNHGEGWQFIQLGRYLERAVSVARLIDVHFRSYLPPGLTYSSWEEDPDGIRLLKACTAFEAYCKVYTADVRPLRVAEFLLLNREFPHSVRYAVDRVLAALTALPPPGDRRQATLSFGHMDEILSTGLHVFLEDLERQCVQIHNAVHAAYIDYPVETMLEV